MKQRGKPLVSEKRAQHILGEATELHHDAYDAYRQRINRQLEAAAFLRGKQYVQRQRDQLVVDPRGEMAEVVNFCRPLVNVAASRMVKRIPNPKIPARKNDQKSEARARFTESCAIAALYNGIINIEELARCVIWNKVTGAGWIHDSWDPNAGRALSPPDDFGFEGDRPPDDEDRKDERSLDEFGFPVFSPTYEGEIRTAFVPTTDALPDPSAKCKEDLKRPGAYFIHVEVLTVRALQNAWPRDYFGKPTGRRFMPGEDAKFTSSTWRADEDESLGRFAGADANTLAEKRSLWRMPDDEYKNGLLLIHSGPVILYVGPLPYFPARLPFTIFYGDNIVPTSLYPDGLLRDIISLQRTTNHVESKKLEILRKMANPHVFVPFNSGIDRNIWGEIPGQIIHYAKGYKPDVMQGADIPQGMFQHTNDQFDRAKFITGYSDLGAGDVPTDISGRAVVFASQNEEASRAIVNILHDQSMVDLVQAVVYHMRQRYDEGRLIRTVGANGMPEAVEFKSDEFDWESDFMPVMYDDSPSTHVAKMSELIELKAAGFFDQTPEAQRMRKMASSSYAARAEWDPFGDDRLRAKREQLAFVENPLALPQVMSFDIHRVHLEEHNKFRKSPEYATMAPWARAKFDRHCDNHAILDRFGDGPTSCGQADNSKINAHTPSANGPPQAPVNQTGQRLETPPDGGQAALPGVPPSIAEFAQMSESEQRASDQR